MSQEFRITVEDDPVPIVLVFATMLRNQLRAPDSREAARSLHGAFAIKSAKDPQAVTITVNGNHIHLERGVRPTARITVIADLDRLEEPGYLPRVKGLLRHPWLTYRVASFLAPAPVADWHGIAERFWDKAQHLPGMPGGLRLVCTDEDGELILGQPDRTMELHGTARNLASLLSGSSLLVADALAGKIRVLGDFHDLTVVTEATLYNMLGDFADE